MKNYEIQKKSQKSIEEYWSAYKYNVMERGYQYYKSVSKSLNQGDSPKEVREIIGKYLLLESSKKAVINTFYHVWGYIKDIATAEEKAKILKAIEDYEDGLYQYEMVKSLLLKLSLKYQVDILIESHYFDELLMISYDEMSSALVRWYDQNHRKLPWRETTDIYKIWLSEIMCQQTQVNTVIPYYEAFLKNWPDIYALSKASEDQVFKAWEGLGYYGRARRLMSCAKKVVEDYGGIFPEDYESIIRLPGIGEYTAGAILSISKGMLIPAVDGNVMRVISRLYHHRDNIKEPSNRRYIEKRVGEIIHQSSNLKDFNISYFNQGLMELGATICTPQNPNCEMCPLNYGCIAKRLGLTDQLPIVSKGSKKKTEIVQALMVMAEGKFMLIKANQEGLLAGLYGLPYTISKQDNDFKHIEKYLYDCFNMDTFTTEKIIMNIYKHVFTHKVWHIHLHILRTNKRVELDSQETVWVSFQEIDQYPISTAFKRVLSRYIMMANEENTNPLKN
ncbi:MAG: A/G-specific adenine glycosylase [Clostridia bacterium]|nr:A/G-specific adenine glycosylase [Clostridia bacterium]